MPPFVACSTLPSDVVYMACTPYNMSDTSTHTTQQWPTGQVRLRNTSQEFVPQSQIKHSNSATLTHHTPYNTSTDSYRNIQDSVSQSADNIHHQLHQSMQHVSIHDSSAAYGAYTNMTDYDRNRAVSDAGSERHSAQQDAYSSQLYKTELCKSYTDTGFCRYGLKCRFAHGAHELRPIVRHKKYKTERCKNYMETGVCPYGPRCRFIHDDSEINQSYDTASDTYSNTSQPYNRQTYMSSPAGSIHSTPSHSRMHTPHQYTDAFSNHNAYTSPVSTVRSQTVSTSISPAIMPASYTTAYNHTNVSSSAGPRAYNSQYNAAGQAIPPLSLYQRNISQHSPHSRHTAPRGNAQLYNQHHISTRQHSQPLAHYSYHTQHQQPQQHHTAQYQRPAQYDAQHVTYSESFGADLQTEPADEHIEIHNSASSAALLRDFDAHDTDDTTDDLSAQQSVLTLLDDNAATDGAPVQQTVSILSMIQSPRNNKSHETNNDTTQQVDDGSASDMVSVSSSVDAQSKAARKAMSPFFSPVSTYSPTFTNMTTAVLPAASEQKTDTSTVQRTLSSNHTSYTSGNTIRQSSTLGMLRTPLSSSVYDGQPSTASTETSEYLRAIGHHSPYLSSSPALSSNSVASQLSPHQSPTIQPHKGNRDILTSATSSTKLRLPVFSNLSVATASTDDVDEQKEYVATSPLLHTDQLNSPNTASERKQ